MKHFTQAQRSSYPSWYWIKGLHDAQILKQCNYPVDRKNLAECHRYVHNCLELDVDSCGALFDTSIQAIRFFNFKELTPGINIEGCWWISDVLSQNGDKYTLEIECGSMQGNKKYIIRFEQCAVVR